MPENKRKYTGFSPFEWLGIMTQYLLADLKANDKDFVAAAKASGFKNAKAYYDALSQQYANMANNAWSSGNWESLPDWGDLRYDWLRTNGTLIADNSLLEANGAYYEPNTGMPVNPQAAQNIIDKVLGTDKGLTEYQKAELEESRKRAEQSAKQWTAEFGLRQKEFEAEQASRQQVSIEELANQERQRLWQQYELDKANRELELERGGPVNWIRRWYNENAPNPYRVGVLPPSEQASTGWNAINQVRQQLVSQGGNVPTPQQLISNPEAQQLAWSIGSQAPESSPAAQLSNLIKQYGDVIRQQQKLAQEQMTAQRAGYTIQKEPAPGPETPAWLPQFVSGLKAGQPISPKTITTPSGQQWARTSPTQQQMLKGYAQYAGQSYEDILNQMYSMTPESPYGVSQTRWVPARARI